MAAVQEDGGVDRLAATLFGESASRVIVSVAPGDVAVVMDRAKAAGVPAQRLGRTGGRAIRITVDGAAAIDVAVPEAEARWSASLSNWLDGRAA